MIFTAAYTGLRWGELASLHVDRVNLLRGTVDVAEAMTETNGHLATAPTKTGARRTVSLPRFLSDMLAGHIAAFPTTTGLVFSSAEGQPLRRNLYRRHFKPAVRNAGLPEALRFHDLRHSCAAMLIAQGAHPKEIQERLGHSTIRLTFDRYGHLFPGLDERLREGLEAGYRAAQDPAGDRVQRPHPPPGEWFVTAGRDELREHLRAEPPPGTDVVVIRGGPDSVGKLQTHARRTQRGWNLDGEPIWGISVFCALDDLGSASLDGLLAGRLGTYGRVHHSRVADMVGLGYGLLPTFGRPHYTIVLPSDEDAELTRLLACLGPPRDNPKHPPNIFSGRRPRP